VPLFICKVSLYLKAHVQLFTFATVYQRKIAIKVQESSCFFVELVVFFMNLSNGRMMKRQCTFMEHLCLSKSLRRIFLMAPG
jgi:hypothetical protein